MTLVTLAQPRENSKSTVERESLFDADGSDSSVTVPDRQIAFRFLRKSPIWPHAGALDGVTEGGLAEGPETGRRNWLEVERS